jgi:small conductance mechanosensitive channel
MEVVSSLIRRMPLLVLMLCLAGNSAAQTTEESNVADLEALIENLDQGIGELADLSAQVDKVAEMDRDALLFRRDARSFSLLMDMDELARHIAELPADDPQRAAVEQRLRNDLADVSNSVFLRIDELDQRIITHTGELESLSGGQRIAIDAYIQSLQAMRVQYYDALVNVVDGRKALGMPAGQISQNLEQALYLRAETLVGRIEFIGAALEQMQGRMVDEPQNAELDATVRTFTTQHEVYLLRLETVAALLARLGLDDAVYKAVLLQQGTGFSVRDFEGAVMMDLVRDGWASLRQSMVDQAPDMFFNLLVFFLIVLGFRALSRLTRRAVVAACDRPGVDLSTLLKDILASVSSGTVMVLGILMALSQIGISLGPMLAGLGVAGFVVGFALQDTLGNFAAGGMILIYRPYDVDDFVEVTGASGLVKKMSLVSTTITTFDNQTLVVPNSRIWGDVIKNVTAQKLRRVDLEFGIGYGDDIEQAERVLADILSNHDMVLKKPESMIKLHTLGDSSVNFVVRPWVKTDDYWDVYWDITREVKMRFDREGISIPFPQRDVHLYNEQA